LKNSPSKVKASPVPWFTSAIQATQQAEIRRIAVQSQLGQIVLKILSQKKTLH
jgi:hypothetical protein